MYSCRQIFTMGGRVGTPFPVAIGSSFSCSLFWGFQQSEHQHPFVSFTEDRQGVSQNSSIQLVSLLLVFCGFGRRIRKHYGTPGWLLSFPQVGEWRRTQSGGKFSRTRREQREGKGLGEQSESCHLPPRPPAPLTCAPGRSRLLTCCPRPMPMPCPPIRTPLRQLARLPRPVRRSLALDPCPPARQIFEPHLTSRAGRWWATATHRARVPRPVRVVARHGHAVLLASL